MMDELGKIRKMLDKATSKDAAASVDDIRNILRNRSLNHIERLQRNILIEILAGSFAFLVILAVAFAYPFKLAGAWLLVPLLFFLFSFTFYARKYYGMRKLKIKPDNNIKIYLEKIVDWIINFSDIYYRLNLILMPFAVLVAIIVTYNIKNPAETFYPAIIESYSPVLVIPALIIYLAFIMLLSHPVLKWYTRKMFGDHISQLRNSLKELQENGSDPPSQVTEP